MKLTDIATVIVTERPNKVYVVVNNEVHTGRWRTVNPGENGIKEHTGNRSLLNAAMFAWDGQEHFTATIQELIDRSGGWGVDLEG